MMGSSKLHKKLKTIEITTSQNVTIEYALASVWERAIALVVDMVIITLSSLILWWLQASLFPYTDNLNYFTILPLIALYSLLFEQLNDGMSPGKMLLKLRVIRLDGEPTAFKDYLMRWMFRGLDLYFSLGGIAILSVVSSRYGQRLGDLLANTVVVTIGKGDRMKLENLLRLNNMGDYEVKYPQVAKMTEETMLVVKETLTRHRDIGNEAHEQALKMLVDKMAKELKVKPPADHVQFLRTLLKDYIVLTR
jgi:uncharacterized RDD family membrane protein YckC